MVLKFIEKETKFLKSLSLLRKDLFEMKKKNVTEKFHANIIFFLLQIEVLWVLKKILKGDLKIKINNFFSLKPSIVTENKYYSVLREISSYEILSPMIFQFELHDWDKFNECYKLIISFIHDYEIEQKNDLDGYLIGLTYEYFMHDKQKSKTGSFYTPQLLAKAISKNSIDQIILSNVNHEFKGKVIQFYDSIEQIKDNATIKNFILEKVLKSITIFDPSMGVGNFLVEAFEYLLLLYDVYSLDKSHYSLLTISHQLFGLDINIISTKITKIRLLLSILIPMSDNIDKKDSYYWPTIKMSDAFENLPPINVSTPFTVPNIKNKFSLILSNPPHGAKLENSLKRKARKYFKTVKGYSIPLNTNENEIIHTKGNPNSAVLFTEICGNLLDENGICSIILPKSLLYIEAWESIRHYLSYEKHILSIIDLQKGFEGVLLEQIICNFTTNDSLIVKNDKIFIEEFINTFESQKKNLIDRSYFNYSKFPITITKENEKIINQISKAHSLKLLSHRGLVISKYLKKEKTDNCIPVVRGKDLQPLFIRSLSYCPRKEIINQPYFMYGTLLIQRIVAHVVKPKPHILLTVVLNPGLPTVDTVVNIYSKEPNIKFSKALAMYLNSELINWYTYHFIYCEAIRSMDIFGYYLNQIPIKSFYDYYNQLASLFEILALLKTIKKNGNFYIKEVDLFIEFLQDMGNAFIYYIYFKDVCKDIQKIILNFDLNNLINQKLFLNVTFDIWYQKEQFLEINKWNIDINQLQTKLSNLMNNIEITTLIEEVEKNDWVRMIKSEFRD